MHYQSSIHTQNTQHTHSRTLQQAHTDYICTLHAHAYLHTNALFMLCNFIETATVAPLYVLSATTEMPHWTTSHHLPPPPNVSLHVSNITSVQFTCMSDGHISNYYQDCILRITLVRHLYFDFFSQFVMLHPCPCLV